MKSGRWIALTIIMVLVVGYFSVQLYTNQRLATVQENVIEMNPEITEIYEIHRIGGWGEWFSEFTLVAEMNGVKYRIWTTDDGIITDQTEY